MKTILVDAVDTFVIEGEGIDEEMHTLLETYPNPKIILTNANDEQMDQFGLTGLPYPVFTMKHNPDKPDSAYFKTMLMHFTLQPENCVYFEHNRDAVESAQSVGITSYHFDHKERNVEALKTFLDSNLE